MARLFDKGIVKWLEAALCKDVVGIILEMVMEHPRRVSKAFSDIMEAVEWDSMYQKQWYEKDVVNVKVIYRGGLYREISRCSDCWSMRLLVGKRFSTSNVVCLSWEKCKERFGCPVRSRWKDNVLTIWADGEPFITARET